MPTMRAIQIEKPTRAEELQFSNVPVPQVKPGWVLVKIKAFGLNHSEQILRLNEIQADYIQKPIIPGIECVGEIENPSDSDFSKGQKVAALMGGMGRSFNGSYAEYALLPVNHVFAVNSDLSWGELAAVPETYFTAWGSLFECLNLQKGEKLLIRGGTCALGYVAIQIAKAFGCTVYATTHREEKLSLISNADRTILDDGELAKLNLSVDKVLELVGPKTLYDSLRCVKKGGIVCNTGILGNVFTVKNFDPIKYIPNGVYLTGFFSNSPTAKIMNDIFDFLDKNNLRPCLGKVYSFENIKNAIDDMDNKKVNGKIVVKL